MYRFRLLHVPGLSRALRNVAAGVPGPSNPGCPLAFGGELGRGNVNTGLGVLQKYRNLQLFPHPFLLMTQLHT